MRRIVKYIPVVLLLLVFYSIIFMQLMVYEGQIKNVDPVTAVYWVITTMTTVGYGDVTLNSSIGRIFSMVVSLSGIAIFFAMILPLVVTPWLERLGGDLPTRAPQDMKDHIIICGYNPIVETLTERFVRQKMPFVVIERSEPVARSIHRKYPVIWGDPAEREVLINANFRAARLLIANEKDERNADIALTVREVSDAGAGSNVGSEVVVVALVEDLARSRFLTYAGASRIISPKTLLGTFIAQITSPPRKGRFPGAVRLFGGLLLVELPIYPGSPLIGVKVHDDVLKKTGASVVGIWQRGSFVSIPHHEEIMSNSVLMAVGEAEPLSALRELTTGPPREGPLIVIGYGDVGRRIVKVLSKDGVTPVVIDRRELCDVCFNQIQGDGTSEDVLEKAGVKEAVGILIMLNNDTDVVFSTLLARNLNRDAFIVARANHVSSAEKMYRAGADYVASVPILASHMLAKIAQAQEEELTMIYEELELIRFQVGKRSALKNKSLRDLRLPERIECSVVAIKRDGEGICDVGPETVVREDDILAIIGSPECIADFQHAYGGRFGFGWPR